MLVLSRGRNDKVIFPSLGMSVEILRISGNKVRLGIDAPRDIPVLRHEIAEQDGHSFRDYGSGRPQGSRLSHSIRNRLNTAALGLHFLQKKLESGDHHEAETTIFKIFNELKAIEDELAPPLRVPGTESDAKPHCRTLLVEDDANESELLAGFLRMSGFEVDTAMDGLQAMVHLAKNERPDVVLMDMRMPRFDGRRTIAAIRANPDYRGLKIFAVSGAEQTVMQVELGPRGVDRWFSKPVDPQMIVEAIHQELGLACISA